MKKKWMSVLAAVMTGTLLLAGCGSSGSGSASANTNTETELEIPVNRCADSEMSGALIPA